MSVLSVYIYRSNVGAPARFEHDPPPAGVIRWQWGELPGPEAATEDRGVSAVTQGGHQSPHPANPQVKQGQGQCMCETGFGRPMTSVYICSRENVSLCEFVPIFSSFLNNLTSYFKIK